MRERSQMSEIVPDAWRRSSFSGGGNNCVEVAEGPSHIQVRDSKNPGGPRLRLTRAAFAAYLDAVAARQG
jgi:hypothetical protein